MKGEHTAADTPPSRNRASRRDVRVRRRDERYPQIPGQTLGFRQRSILLTPGLSRVLQRVEAAFLRQRAGDLWPALMQETIACCNVRCKHESTILAYDASDLFRMHIQPRPPTEVVQHRAAQSQCSCQEAQLCAVWIKDANKVQPTMAA